ncbi:conserved hypothetical protein [Pseudomonas sp. 8AS]|uniref:DUF4123 domain-containing protein n=1 Tax=Pseudomonas sp. 8AS TaxID=2653163 RepID=UPI0012F40E9A|nr:DUF4123 domain-containing protein [Pseudomonas sp. 8AS]VXB06262.1 conserved hypothetical protein [Pseudomonas sp. 8AS]
MHEGLSEFLKLPRRELPMGGNGLHFIIDPARQPEALAQLYNCGQPIEVEYLLHATEFAHLAESGPIWVNVGRSHELTQLCARLCQERQAGIAIRAENPQQALAHARSLLKISDGSGGQSLATYYQPALWAALAMTALAQAALFGPWSAVASPALVHLQNGPGRWLDWQPLAGRSATANSLALADNSENAYATLRWLYWIDQEHRAFDSPTQAELSALIDNLNALGEHGITDERHLLRLTELLRGPALDSRPAVMAILQDRAKAFLKTERLQELGAS